MTAQSDPYVRVYYRIIDDPRFAMVFDEDAALAAWMRLLLYADAMYPAPAPLPKIKHGALRKLIDAGLIEMVSGGRYRVHGMASERDRRAKQPADAARARWEAQRNANADAPQNADASRSHPRARATPAPSNSEQLLSEPSNSAPANAIAGLASAVRSFPTNGLQPPEDEQLIQRSQAILADPTASDDLRTLARNRLEDLGVTVP